MNKKQKKEPFSLKNIDAVQEPGDKLCQAGRYDTLTDLLPKRTAAGRQPFHCITGYLVDHFNKRSCHKGKGRNQQSNKTNPGTNTQ